jgi:hypothetical protein
MKSIIAAILLVSTVAHAEYLTPKKSEVRQQAIQKSTKAEKAIKRQSVAVAPASPAPAVARGLEIDDVLAKVNGVYMTGLQWCYRKSLAVDPIMSGRVDLQFKVAADGRVISALQGDGIERCLSTLMSSWRFGVALDDSGTPTDASFKIALVLR